jgi:aminoglycoside phosphotransferase (APT) family kinase protein
VGTVLEPDHDDLLLRATGAARRTRPDAVVTGLRRLEGGVSSLTYASTLETRGERLPIVVKVAPPGLAPVRNRDVLRQAGVLHRLAGLDGFPVPGVVLEDEGAPPDVPPLFAMELRPGDSYEPLLDVSPTPPDAETAATRMRVAVRALARLHAETPKSLGLGDEPVSPVTEELQRWRRLFATVDPGIGAGHEKLAARLAERPPVDGTPALLHGDYRVANMLFLGPVLEAVIDWEIWSVGDPRSDLAWLLMHVRPAQVFHEQRPPADRAAGALMPSMAELTTEYVDARRAYGADERSVAAATADLAWFLGVCYYKTASTIAVIWKRERRRPDPDPKLAVAARHLDEVLEAGHRVLDRRDAGQPPA